MRLYLDNCCLNRPFDGMADSKVREEAEAVMRILDEISKGMHVMIDSQILRGEVLNCPNPDRRGRLDDMRKLATAFVPMTVSIHDRGAGLHALGFGPYDALHIASAEHARADILLTTDVRLLKKAAREKSIRVRVENPANFWRERTNR